MDPFYIFGVHLNTIFLISVIISIIAFFVMMFSIDVGRSIFKVSIGLLAFCILYWLSILFYYLFGLGEDPLSSGLFYIILVALIVIFIVVYISFKLGDAFFG